MDPRGKPGKRRPLSGPGRSACACAQRRRLLAGPPHHTGQRRLRGRRCSAGSGAGQDPGLAAGLKAAPSPGPVPSGLGRLGQVGDGAPTVGAPTPHPPLHTAFSQEPKCRFDWTTESLGENADVPGSGPRLHLLLLGRHSDIRRGPRNPLDTCVKHLKCFRARSLRSPVDRQPVSCKEAGARVTTVRRRSKCYRVYRFL